MKTLFILSFISLGLYACNPNGSKSSKIQPVPDSLVSSNTDTLCFAKYSGLQNQDTALVSMIIKNNSVSGRFTDFIYEKDGRTGTLTGVVDNGIIKGIWRYNQEGIDDSLRVEFKLQGNILLQRKPHYDPNTGHEAISDTSAFSLKYQRVNCVKE